MPLVLALGIGTMLSPGRAPQAQDPAPQCTTRAALIDNIELWLNAQPAPAPLVQSILAARQAGGRFATLAEFCERVDLRAVNRKAIECLVKAGAMDSLGTNRATLWSQVEGAVARASSLAADRARGQASLFDTLDIAPEATAPTASVEDLPDWPVGERLAHEKELLGFYVSGHPLDPYARVLRRFAVHTVEELASLPSRSMTRIGGLVGSVQQGVSKKSGKPYAMVTLEDLTGTVQLLALNESYDRFRDLFVPNAPLLVTGEVQGGEDKPKVFPTDVLPLDEAPKRLSRQVQLRVPAARLDRSGLESIRDLAAAHPGRTPWFLCVQMPRGETVFIEPNDRYHVTPSREFEAAVTHLFGPDAFSVSGDKTLPERPARRWERRGGNGSGGDDG